MKLTEQTQTKLLCLAAVVASAIIAVVVYYTFLKDGGFVVYAIDSHDYSDWQWLFYGAAGSAFMWFREFISKCKKSK
jgi:H+/Cl- antiporter ClcA